MRVSSIDVGFSLLISYVMSLPNIKRGFCSPPIAQHCNQFQQSSCRQNSGQVAFCSTSSVDQGDGLWEVYTCKRGECTPDNLGVGVCWEDVVG